MRLFKLESKFPIEGKEASLHYLIINLSISMDLLTGKVCFWVSRNESGIPRIQ